MTKYIPFILLLVSFFLKSIEVSGQTVLNTMSEVNNTMDDVEFRTLLETDIQKANPDVISGKNYLLPLINYIDLNVIGKGYTLTIDVQKLKDFIVKKINAGVTNEDLANQLVIAFKNNEFDYVNNNADSSGTEKPKVTVGGFFVTEYEYHQEPDGNYHSLLEINQTRIYFSAEINPNQKKNIVSFLAEWNPIPEEVIHQIDEIQFYHDSNIITIAVPEPSGMDHSGSIDYINFERLNVKIENVANSGMAIRVGQFQNPFGIWGDYTSHRNFNSSKNNQLVNGFALKKIELGVRLDMEMQNGFEWKAAIMHGRLTRTSNLPREDSDDQKDFCGRIGYRSSTFSLGASAYFAEFRTDRIATGVDYSFDIHKFSISGEIVYQQNTVPQQIFEVPDDITKLSSFASYLQVDFRLSHRIHIYGLYEFWDYRQNNTRIYEPEGKIFHGIRYSINNNLRWTMFEYGHMFHTGYDKGENHFSTQLELIF